MHDPANLLPPECIGRERLLSRALYRAAMNCTNGERPFFIYRSRGRFDLATIAAHILLLPSPAVTAIRDSLIELRDQQESLRASRKDPGYDATYDRLFAWIDEVPPMWVAEMLQHISPPKPTAP